jgi:hypothetical protein
VKTLGVANLVNEARQLGGNIGNGLVSGQVDLLDLNRRH